MSKVGRRVFDNLTRYSLCRCIFLNGGLVNLRGLNSLRPLSVTSQLSAQSGKTKGEDEEDNEEMSKPIKFSTSQASHRTWNVDRSLGSKFQRPWWKVLPISLFGVAFVLWCMFREESEIDTTLKRELYEHLPGLLSDEDQEKLKDKKSPT
ncbi:ubiquinol-cytochrome c reductase complex assembly factor 4 [Chanos chanos]|uniref:Ubiquinol-cytochrome c reductase complex assembly factor 4 n=1 Tax=Chanos chanos TaxID=29144 RepID=A0A6J2V1P3_CHACN|nr:protein CCSMST1 [Chanos chanos]